MQLISAERLRAFVGPEADKKISGRRLARAIDTHPSFIDHLLSGRSKSCKPVTAQRIAETLGVPWDLLFLAVTPSDRQHFDKPQTATAATSGTREAS